MATYDFQEVSYHATKAGVCKACGKRASLKRKFWQTLNPFNKTATGEVKTPSQIRDELRRDAEAWYREPLCHAKCQSA